MAEEKTNAPSNASAGLVQQSQSQALNQVSNLVTNYNASNEANRPATVEAFKNHLFKLDRGVVKKMFDSARDLRNKPDLNFTIPELPGLFIPKKIFTEDLKVPAKAFMVDYDRKNYQELQVKSQAAAAAKSEGSSTKLDAAKATVLGTGLGTVGSALGGMVGIRPSGGRRSKTQAEKTEATPSTSQRKTEIPTTQAETVEEVIRKTPDETTNAPETVRNPQEEAKEAQPPPSASLTKTLRGVGPGAPVRPIAPMQMPSKVTTLRGPVSSTVGQAPVVSATKTLRGSPAASGKPIAPVTGKTLRGPTISNVPLAAPSAGAAAPVAAPAVQITAEGEIKNEAEVQTPNIPAPPSPAASGGKGAPQTVQIQGQGEMQTEIKVTMPTTGSRPVDISKEISIQAPASSEVNLPPPISPVSPGGPAPAPSRRSRLETYGRQPTALPGAPVTSTPQNIVRAKPGQTRRAEPSGRSQPARVPVLPSRRGPIGAEVSRPGTRRTTELEPAPTAGGQGQAQTAGQELATPSAPTEQPMSAAATFGATRTPSSPTTKRPSSRVSVVPGTRDDGTMGRPGRRSYKSVGPQDIKPPISRAMDLHAAQSQAWRGREMEYGEDGSLSADEGLELSESGIESELSEGPENQPALPMQYGQFFNPIERRGGYYEEGKRGPGSMPIEEEAEDETAGGGTPEGELERLKSFQSRQREDSMAGEQLTGAPSARLRNVKPEPPSTRQLVSQVVGRGQTAGSGGPGKMDEIGMALKLLSSQVSSKLQADQRRKQYEDFKEKIESLKRGKQAFKNLLDTGQIGAGESGVTLLTIWAEWNIDLINKHVANGKIPFFEQKPSTGSLPLEKTISQVKDGITILADILIPISFFATLIIPLTITALIIVSFFGTFLKLADFFGIKLF